VQLWPFPEQKWLPLVQPFCPQLLEQQSELQVQDSPSDLQLPPPVRPQVPLLQLLEQQSELKVQLWPFPEQKWLPLVQPFCPQLPEQQSELQVHSAPSRPQEFAKANPSRCETKAFWASHELA